MVGIPAVVFVNIGAILSRFFDSRIFKLVLSTFLIAVRFIFYFFKGQEAKTDTLQFDWWGCAFWLHRPSFGLGRCHTRFNISSL